MSVVWLVRTRHSGTSEKLVGKLGQTTQAGFSSILRPSGHPFGGRVLLMDVVALVVRDPG